VLAGAVRGYIMHPTDMKAHAAAQQPLEVIPSCQVSFYTCLTQDCLDSLFIGPFLSAECLSFALSCKPPDERSPGAS